MLNIINKFINTYQRAGPQRYLLYSIHRIKRLEVISLHTWKAVKDTTKNIDICGELFDIPLDYHARHVGLILLKYFKNVDATPFVYDRLVGSWI